MNNVKVETPSIHLIGYSIKESDFCQNLTLKFFIFKKKKNFTF